MRLGALVTAAAMACEWFPSLARGGGCASIRCLSGSVQVGISCLGCRLHRISQRARLLLVLSLFVQAQAVKELTLRRRGRRLVCRALA